MTRRGPIDAAVDELEAVLHPRGRCAECGGGEGYWKHDPTREPHHPFRPRAVMDFPDAWAFVRDTRPEDHHERCSWRTTRGAFLCDCRVLWDEYDRRAATSALCGDCDGVGWVEGGATIKTTCARCAGSGIEPPSTPIGYRYEVTAVSGRVPPGVVVGGHVVDPEFKGPEYTWQVVDLPTGRVTASWDGRYVGVRSLETA